ncbi:MAG: helix-turn-helix domain-containing protein [Candidatus ainarchaeum sp.]|nr:helix-turn-helix domain-containing protein [Candidatus ainarchaeum sp.]
MFGEHVNNLKYLGLTEYQAKVLYALMKNKVSTISEIENIAGVPKTRIYDVMKELMDKDYVIQIEDKPKKYRIRNVDLVLDNLVETKEKEFNNVKVTVGTMKEMFKTNEMPLQNKMIHMDKKNFLKLLNEELANANLNICAFSGSEIGEKELKERLKKAVEKNISVKIVTHPEHKKHIWEIGGEGREFNHNLLAYLIDGKKAIFRLNTDSEQQYKVSIVENNDGLVNMMKSYFDNCWAQGK